MMGVRGKRVAVVDGHVSNELRLETAVKEAIKHDVITCT